MKDKMYRTINQMILFRLLQSEECSLLRNILKKRKRQVNKGVFVRKIGEGLSH